VETEGQLRPKSESKTGMLLKGKGRARSRSPSVSSSRKRDRSLSPTTAYKRPRNAASDDLASGEVTRGDNATPTAIPSGANPCAQMTTQVRRARQRQSTAIDKQQVNCMEKVPSPPPSGPLNAPTDCSVGGIHAEVGGENVGTRSARARSPEAEGIDPIVAQLVQILGPRLTSMEQELRRLSDILNEHFKPDGK
jgi:hypothetical protein